MYWIENTPSSAKHPALICWWRCANTRIDAAPSMVDTSTHCNWSIWHAWPADWTAAFACRLIFTLPNLFGFETIFFYWSNILLSTKIFHLFKQAVVDLNNILWPVYYWIINLFSSVSLDLPGVIAQSKNQETPQKPMLPVYFISINTR